MRKLIALCMVLLAATNSPAQAIDPLVFREKVFDFGELREVSGPATHEFLFTNSSGRPVRILNVTASCGCTTPGWTKEPVLPGKSGFVKALFDPKGRPGYFNKTLTVTTDLDANPIVLSIKGTVVDDEPGDADLMVRIGNLKLKSRAISMGTIYLNKSPAEKQLAVKNVGDTPIKFLSVQKPAYVKVDMPDELDPGKTLIIRVTYDAKARNVYGFASDNLLFSTNDPVEEMKSISLFATVEEYFAPPSAEELSTAPLAFFRELSLDLGQYPAGASLERTVMLYNRGKKELTIKALQGNCTCITAEAAKRSVRAGDSTQIKILFKPQARGGTQQKAVSVFTNDPRNPVQLISVSVYINE